MHIVCDIADDICRLKLLVFCKHSAVSGQRSVVSGQRSVVSGQWSANVTQIKLMLTCCLDAVAHGGNHGSRSWGEPPRPRCLPKTALHRLFKSTSSSVRVAHKLKTDS
ncbi:hypothetical protein [Moorena sp. SIOASIH]|uniref:hypothetical protein n=1 Tax=Moorena sp. SIOASIH TaxID=2607817 RepID=UPI0025EE3F5E|nr:hypothetical protein [Moorena sp. SIOASIH]